MPLYSDSANAISWVKQKKCKKQNHAHQRLVSFWRLIERAEKWLKEMKYSTPIQNGNQEWEKYLLISEGNKKTVYRLCISFAFYNIRPMPKLFTYHVHNFTFINPQFHQHS